MINRRRFVGSLAYGVCTAASSRAAAPRIDGGIIRSQIEALSVFGRLPGGTFQDGVSRVGYSDADIAGRKYVMDLMRRAGASVRIDAAGNIFASRSGSDPSLKPVLFGSHIDSVPNGGNFDGDLGSLSAVAILQLLHDLNTTTRRPLTAVVWACEEASFSGVALNGSRLAAGKAAPGELAVVSRGMAKAEAIRRIGGDPDHVERALIPKDSYHAYVELHIEQGGTLERDGVAAGVVDGIVSIDDYNVVVTGFANHAGTTPMAQRQDALVAASMLTLAVRDIVTAEPGAQVGTVGHIDVSPNATNVIPGEVRLTVELRDLSSAKIARLGERVRARVAAIATETRTTIEMKLAGHNETAGTAPEVQRVIPLGSRNKASPERCRPRRANDGDPHAHGHDLRAKRCGHQPLAQRADALAGLHQRRQRAARDGARAGVEVGSVWASRKDEADVNSFSPAVSRIVTDTSQ
jgi:N-carbamoyl-L-amino-acid hydrolase